MKRPLMLYFITFWLFISLATFPTRYKYIVTPFIGDESFRIVAFAFIVGAFFISFNLFKCKSVYIFIALFVFGSLILFINSKSLFMVIKYWDNMEPKYFIGLVLIGFNIFSFIYLMRKNNQKKLAEIRKQIEAEETRRFQLKQLKR